MTFIPLHSLGSEYRIGRCNTRATVACSRRPVFAWLASTGLRLDDVTCPHCHRGLDRTSREAAGHTMLSDAEISQMRDEAIRRAETRLSEYLETAKAWDDEQELHEPGSEGSWRCQFNYDRYTELAAQASATLKRLRKATA